jgi:hypothetical protein
LAKAPRLRFTFLLSEMGLKALWMALSELLSVFYGKWEGHLADGGLYSVLTMPLESPT